MVFRQEEILEQKEARGLGCYVRVAFFEGSWSTRGARVFSKRSYCGSRADAVLLQEAKREHPRTCAASVFFSSFFLLTNHANALQPRQNRELTLICLHCLRYLSNPPHCSSCTHSPFRFHVSASYLRFHLLSPVPDST